MPTTEHTWPPEGSVMQHHHKKTTTHLYPHSILPSRCQGLDPFCLDAPSLQSAVVFTSSRTRERRSEWEMSVGERSVLLCVMGRSTSYCGPTGLAAATTQVVLGVGDLNNPYRTKTHRGSKDHQADSDVKGEVSGTRYDHICMTCPPCPEADALRHPWALGKAAQRVNSRSRTWSDAY